MYIHTYLIIKNKEKIFTGKLRSMNAGLGLSERQSVPRGESERESECEMRFCLGLGWLRLSESQIPAPLFLLLRVNQA
jgi:hypothetical protein